MLWMLCKAQNVKKSLKDRKRSDFMILVQIWSKFSSGFALKRVRIWPHFDQSWSYLTIGCTAEARQGQGKVKAKSRLGQGKVLAR